MVVDLVEARGGRFRVTAGLLWSGVQDRDRLDVALHAGRWYRPFVGYHEARRTPYDVLRDFIDTGRLSPPPLPQWRPIVFSNVDGSRSGEALGYVSTQPDDVQAVPTLVLFGQASVGQLVVAEAAQDDDDRTETCYRLDSELVGTIPDEAAFDVAGGRIFAAVEWSEAEVEARTVEPSVQILHLPLH
jgi:hypothetical protein